MDNTDFISTVNVNINELWQNILDEIAKSVSALSFDVWIKDLEVVELKDNTLVLSTGTKSSQAMINKTYKAKITEACNKVYKVISNVDIVIKDEIKANIITGTSNRDKLIELIESYSNSGVIDITDDRTRLFDRYEELGITNHPENVRAYLKIQDGCDNFCSYCLIPYRRGKSRSRSHDNIVKEAVSLVENGYKEIVLTGIHVGGYGKDLENESFSMLVKDLLDIKGLERLRISSIEESEIDDLLIELINTRKNLAKHFHIPLQSGSDSVLKRMNRKYNKEQFLSKLNSIKRACPDVALTTDVIVGFPGESEEEFIESYEFIKECGFNMIHAFPFSSREGTAASKLPNQVDPKIKKERNLKMIELSNELWDRYTSEFNGKKVEVLVERYDENTKENIGHTSNYIEVKYKSDENNVGKIVEVEYKK